jgi:hypothetical protein
MKEQVRAYQVRGTSESGDIPGWRRFDAAQLQRPRALREAIDGPRYAGSSQYGAFDVVLEAVR